MEIMSPSMQYSAVSIWLMGNRTHKLIQYIFKTEISKCGTALKMPTQLVDVSTASPFPSVISVEDQGVPISR